MARVSRASWEKWLGEKGKVPSPTSPPARGARRAVSKTPSTSVRRTRQQYEEYRRREIEQVLQSDREVPDLQEVRVDPVPKPRMTQADRWKKRPSVLRYRAFADELRLRQVELPHSYRLEFVLPMPASWSEEFRSEMDGKPHLVRPDSSNLAKAVEDALVPKDERLYRISASKVWGREGCIRIYNMRDNFEGGADVAS